MTKWIIENGIEWIVDDNGNKCSVQYFGSKKAAEEALLSLESCKNCINCSDCRSCHFCSFCSDCRSCHFCSDCSFCSDCRSCHFCSGCSFCRFCSFCSDCRFCSDCSDCRSCHFCSFCSDCSFCSFKEKQTGEFKLPEIPKIENIHQQVLVAVSQPNALDMATWHTCETTHCRAGWVVHMAGAVGKELEKFYDTPLAALKIYRANSNIPVHITDFFKTNEEAMVDIKNAAELEKQQAEVL